MIHSVFFPMAKHPSKEMYIAFPDLMTMSVSCNGFSSLFSQKPRIKKCSRFLRKLF